MEKIAKQRLGVIDALSAGFELVLRNPWVVLLPIALDLFLWFGPQISIKPLSQQFLPLFSTSLPPNASADAVETFQAFQSAIQETFDTLNLFGMIAAYGALATGFPSVFGVQPPTSESTGRVWLSINDSATFVITLIPLTLIGILVMSIYLEPIARLVRRETAWAFIRTVPRSILMTAWLTLMVTLGMLAILIPLSYGADLLSRWNQGLGSFVVLMGMFVLMWFWLYLAYALPAIFVGRQSAAPAMLNSIILLRFDFWSTAGLILLAYIIRMGFAIVWQMFIDNTWGILFVLLANAFLGSGLIAAIMVFYADRMKTLTTLTQRPA